MGNPMGAPIYPVGNRPKIRPKKVHFCHFLTASKLPLFDRFKIAIFGVKQVQKLCKTCKIHCTMIVYVNGMDLAISSLFLKWSIYPIF